MTNKQLDAIRDRVETAHRNPGCCSTRVANDLRILLDEVERLTAEREILHELTDKAAAEWRAGAFRRGANAMREAAAQACEVFCIEQDGFGYAGVVRETPIPEDK